MSKDSDRLTDELDRRSVLQSIGGAGVVGLAAAGTRGAAEDNSPAQTADQPPGVRGSVEQVVITGAVPGATLTLYDSTGTSSAQSRADARGSYVFADVVPGEGYRATQTVDGTESPRSEPVRVYSPAYTPPQSFYDEQELTEGFGYLEVRDGTTLASQVLLPERQDPPYPTLILHSGYEPSVEIQGGRLVRSLVVEQLGYAVVGVNMRGSGCSGGKFDFGGRLQRLDGYDMVETIAAQEWADSVGLFGISFPGFTQLYVAASQPPSLDAIAPGAPIGDFYRDTAYPGGIQNIRFATEWARERDEAFEPGGPAGNVDERIDSDDETCAANQQLRLQNRKIVEQMENNPYFEGLFRERAPLQLVDQIEVPTMLVVSWQDEQTGPRAARLAEFLPAEIPTRFVGTNGSHTATFTPEIIDELIRFYRYYLKEKPPSGVDRPYEAALADYESDPVSVYWERSAAPSRLSRTARFQTSHSEWPPADVESWELYCQPDGTLAASPPEAVDTETTSYEYTPLSPDEQQIERNDDGLLEGWEQRPEEASVAFVSEKLDETHVCLGSGLVELWLASTAEDTDVQVTLSEVRPDGREMFVQMGVLRASHRKENPERTKPRRPWHTHRRADNQPLGEDFARMRVELFPFGHVFREGSRVRVAIEVPGGNRDRWAFELLEQESTNEIAHTAAMASKVTLPLVPEVDAEIPGYPDCGNVRHQPCRPADSPPKEDEDPSSGAQTGDSTAGTAPGNSSSTTGTDSDASGPGFTVGGALASLGGAGYLLKRRLDGETDEPR